MRSLIMVLITVLCIPAFAGFQGFNGDSDLDIFNKLKCDAGMTCSKVGDKFEMDVDHLEPQVAATATTITSDQCGSTFVSGGAVEMDLPEASTVLGCRLTFIVGDATNFTVDPDDADQIVLLTDAAGDSLIADAVGESLVIEAISASEWAPVGAEKGTWTDSN